VLAAGRGLPPSSSDARPKNRATSADDRSSRAHRGAAKVGKSRDAPDGPARDLRAEWQRLPRTRAARATSKCPAGSQLPHRSQHAGRAFRSRTVSEVSLRFARNDRLRLFDARVRGGRVGSKVAWFADVEHHRKIGSAPLLVQGAVHVRPCSAPKFSLRSDDESARRSIVGAAARFGLSDGRRSRPRFRAGGRRKAASTRASPPVTRRRGPPAWVKRSAGAKPCRPRPGQRARAAPRRRAG